MRPLVLPMLLVSFACATTAEARLFWQTYGSVVPHDALLAEGSCGGGCTWNWNQDYFVPRYPSSGRYGLFSPCKVSRTTSPACVWSHPFYPGYCNIYVPLRYKWRNHVYRAHCGCAPLQLCHGPKHPGCGCGCRLAPGSVSCGPGSMLPLAEGLMTETADLPPHVEAPQFRILGSIPVENNGLLTGLDLPAGDIQQQRALLSAPATAPASLLQSLGLPQSVNPAELLPKP